MRILVAWPPMSPAMERVTRKWIVQPEVRARSPHIGHIVARKARMEIPHCRREHHDIAGALLVRQNEFAGCHRSQESGEWVHSVPHAEAAGNDSALNQRRSSLRGAGHRLNGLIGRGPSGPSGAPVDGDRAAAPDS